MITAFELISPNMLSRLEKQFVRDSGWAQADFEIALEEFVKFARLALVTESTFIPTAKLVDEIWHTFILQTEEYERFCDRVAPGKFLHHAGITYEDYASGKTADELLSEDLSWVASYVENFGEFTLETVSHWPFANHLIEKHGWSIEDLNIFAAGLATAVSDPYLARL